MTRKVFLILLAVALALSVGLVACGEPVSEQEEEEDECEDPPAGLVEFEEQPDNEHTHITCQHTDDPTDVEDIVDVQFANALHDALGDNGFHSMVITFAQCHSGGMMDDVADAFDNSEQPISMNAAAMHSEGSKSAPYGPYAADTGYNYWAEAYKDAHPGIADGNNRNPTECEAFRVAKTMPAWTDGSQASTPQYLALQGGCDIILGYGVYDCGTGEGEAASYHAILFAGDTGGRADFWNDIAEQHYKLVASGYPAGNIWVLYGDGAIPANSLHYEYGNTTITDGGQGTKLKDVVREGTRANLLEAIRLVGEQMNADEQLYIFITNHGGDGQGTDTLPPTGKPVSPEEDPNEDNTFYFGTLTEYLIAALQSENNVSGPYVWFAVASESEDPITANWEVLFNGDAMAVNDGNNTFPDWVDQAPGVPGVALLAFSFPINGEAVSLNEPNYVSLTNRVTDDSSIRIMEMYFCMGDIATARE
jgi:hypothetical protein